MQENDPYKHLIQLLEKAVSIASQYGGHYQGRFNNAEEFLEELRCSIYRINSGKRDEIYRLYGWFVPAGDWNNITGQEGMEFGEEIFKMIQQLVRENKTHNTEVKVRKLTLWGWIKAVISSIIEWTP